MDYKILKRVLLICAGIVAFLVLVLGGFRFYTKSFSPEKTVTYQEEEFAAEIIYCQPSKRDRIVFGGLVPYNQVWRTGANEATVIKITKDVIIGGKRIMAGKYSVFTIPALDHWTFILNYNTDLWGTNNYDPAQDVVRVKVPVVSLDEVREKLEIGFEEDQRELNLSISWDQTKISVPIRVVS